MKKLTACMLALVLLLMACSGALAITTTAEKDQLYNLALDALVTYMENPGDDQYTLTGIIENFEKLNKFEQSAKLLYYAQVLQKIEDNEFDHKYDQYLGRLVNDEAFCKYLSDNSDLSALGTPQMLQAYGEGRRAEWEEDFTAAMAAYDHCVGFYDSDDRYELLSDGQLLQNYQQAVSLLNKKKYVEAYFMFVKCGNYKDSRDCIKHIVKTLGYDPAVGTPVPVTTPPVPTLQMGNNKFLVEAGQVVRLQFTAPSKGTYLFATKGSDDTYGYLFSSATATKEITADDDGSGDGKNFLLKHYMNAGQTVYVGVKFFDQGTGAYVTLNVSAEATPSPATAAPKRFNQPFPSRSEQRLPREQAINVYSGPSTDYYRANNGKAQLSTNDSIIVWGYERGWYMISYGLSSGGYRFGYIQASRFQGSFNTSDLDFAYTEAVLTRTVSVTDDPDYKQTEVQKLYSGTRVTYLATYNGWYYIECSAGNGSRMRGFIPSGTLQ